MRYTILAVDPQGQQFTFPSEDYATPDARKAHFAELAKPIDQGGQGIRILGAQPLAPEPPTATTTPPSTTTPAAVGMMQPPLGPQPLSNIQPPGATQAQVGQQRMSALTNLASAGLAGLAPEIAPVRAGIALLRQSTSPLIRTLGPTALRAGATALGGGLGGGLGAAVEGKPVLPNAIDQAFTSAVASGTFDLAGSAFSRGWNALKSVIGVEMSSAQQEGLHRAWQAARAEGRSFSVTGYVQQAPEFAGTKARQQVERMAELGGKRLWETAGVPQVRYAERQAGEALKAAGGPLAPQAQGVSPGFGEDIRRLIDDAKATVRQQAETTARATTKVPPARLGTSEKKIVRTAIGDLKATGPETAQRIASARQIPSLRAEAKQAAGKLYERRIEAQVDKAYKARLAQVKDETGINLETATQESLARKLRSSTTDQVSALVGHFPEFGPTIARAKLTQAAEKAGQNAATDSFDLMTYAEEIRKIGEHNYDAVFGANAPAIRKFLTDIDSYVEGALLARSRAGLPGARKIQWQVPAASLGPLARAAGGGGLGALLGGPTGGAAGAMFGATTSIVTQAPRVYTRALTTQRGLKSLTRVTDIGNGEVPGFVMSFVRNTLPQLLFRTGDILPPAQPGQLTETMQPSSSRY